jgi:hypothetical protein
VWEGEGDAVPKAQFFPPNSPPRLEVSPIYPYIYFLIKILNIKAIDNYFFNQNTSEKTAIAPVKK